MTKTSNLTFILEHGKFRLLLLLFLSPLFWWITFNINFAQFKNSPEYLNQKINTTFSEEKLRPIEEMRWQADFKNPFLAQIFYNRIIILPDEFFSLLTFLSPRIYFQAGDGTALSPPGVEPIPVLLFPFWVLGIISTIHKKNWRPFVFLFSWSTIAFLIGQRNFYFIAPIALIYIYLANKGLDSIKPKWKVFIFFALLIYSSYLIGRALWLQA